jgi:hypothetical protein
MKKVEPNGLIEIKGEVQLKSDEPKMCFASTFKQGDMMDYFTCKECKINCKSTPFFLLLFFFLHLPFS